MIFKTVCHNPYKHRSMSGSRSWSACRCGNWSNSRYANWSKSWPRAWSRSASWGGSWYNSWFLFGEQK